LIHHAPVAAEGGTAYNSALSTVPRAVLIARIQERHLFGDASPAAAAPVLTSSGSVSVIGIVYSVDTADSVALLSVGGNSVVSHVGSQLSTGQTVTGILPDRVQLSGGTGSVNLLLDIKQADTDQRTTPGQYAGISGRTGVPADDAPDASLGPAAPPAPPSRAEAAPTQFVSLKSLRGGAAAQRFQGLNAPIQGHKPPP